jgi:hypothetical protein
MRSLVFVGFSSLLFLACGKDDPIAPTASIVSPETGAEYYADQKILFEGLITDDTQSPNELTVLWKSDIDGDLDWANEPDSKGRISGHGYLTEGEHSVSLTATDLDDLMGRDSLLLSIGPANSAPSCAITAPPEGTATNEGDTVTLIAQVDDVDIGPEELTLSWTSDVDGDLGSSTADLNGLSTLEVSSLVLGTHTIILTVTDEMGLECQVQVIHKIGQVPRLSWVWPDADAILSAENPGYAHVSVDDDYHSPEDLVVLWESSIDGSLTPDPIDAFGNSMRDLGDLSLGTHVLTATATNPDDLTGTASLTFTINGVPDAPSVVIAPDPATTTDDLVAVVSAGADPEGDSQTFLYQWSKDGVLDSSITGDVVPNPMTAKNEVWTVRVTPNDGYGNGPLGEASIVVSNSLPIVSVVSISPTNPTVSDTLVCSYGFSDDDSDPDASTIEWTVGSTVVGTGASLAAGSAAKGDTVVCTVTANDGEEGGNNETDSVTILNTAPVVSTVTIDPASGVTTSSSLSCSYTASDADGETLSEDYTWTNGSTTLGTTSTLSLTNTTSSPTDTITCSVTVTDSSSATASGSASVSVENTLPVVSAVTLSPTDPTVTDTVTCTYTASDADGDTPTASYAWTSGTSSLGTASSLDLSTTSVAKGDGLSCEVTVTDDQGDTASDSASATIANSVPSVSGVSISPSSPSVTDGLSCSYTFADDDSDTDASSVIWTVGSSTVGTGTTLAAGTVTKNQTVTCTVTPSDGTESGTAGSDAVTVVNTAPVVSAVSISPSSPTVSDPLICSYSFADDDTDTDVSSVTWTVGSSTVGTGTTLSAGSATKGETVTCSVEADDGEDLGNTDTASTTIQNSAPTTPVVSISPTAPVAQTDDLICSIDTVSTDADTDTITYTFLWEVDGASWTGSTSTTTEADDTVDATNLTYDEEWTCIVTPDDGTVSGTAGEDSVTVQCQDADGDGYADDSCGGTDCDDSDSSLTPEDADGDGYSSCDGDCDDQNSNFNPGATDGLFVDRDCDGSVSGGSLSLSDYKLVGENKKDLAGYSLSSAGDVDGDGLDDVLVGAYGNDDGGTEAGAAYVVLGSSLGTTRTIDLSTADYKLVGEDTYDYTGYSVSSAGDVDGDGLDDVLVGSQYDDDGANNAGAAYVVLGSSLGTTSTIDLSTSDYKLVGEGFYAQAGYSVSSAGDVDGDGLDDVLVGAIGDNDGGGYAGAAYVVLGASLGTTSTIDLSNADYKLVGESSDRVGWDVSSAGDVDGDGLGDVLLGAHENDDGGQDAGAAYLVLGASLGTSSTIDLSNADYKLVGESPNDFAGLSVSSAGDVDGDGLDDVLVGAYGNDDGGTEAGAAYLVLGASLGTSSTIDLVTADYKLVGEDSNDYAGYRVSTAGDVDGDGLDDVLVGAHLDDDGATNAGAVYVVLGSSLGTISTLGLSNADYKLVGESSSDTAGVGVSSAGDVDGDGLDDVLVGCRYDADGGSNAGAAYLILTGG